MKIGGLQKLTLLDYPGKVACTVFTVGCNFRCPFCHNAPLVEGEGEDYSEEDILQFLRKRRTVLEGVCLTGGEPLLQRDAEHFLREVKDMGYAVKLDTNGAFPDKLQRLAEEKLIDYVAMDVKNRKQSYDVTTGVKTDIAAVERSVQFLKSGFVDYEFRTTVTGSLHTAQDMTGIGEWLKGGKVLYLQKFVNSGSLIDQSVTGCDGDVLRGYRDMLQVFLPTRLRGIDD